MIEQVGDHTVMVQLPTDNRDNSTLVQLMTKLEVKVVKSFHQRNYHYTADIRRLERGLPNFDFRQLFLVKESLALMFQMMQLPEWALKQYVIKSKKIIVIYNMIVRKMLFQHSLRLKLLYLPIFLISKTTFV